MQKIKFKSNLLKVIIAGNLMFFLPNLLLLMRGFESRYWADDYCFSGILKQFGFLKGLEYFYTTVSNRFSAYIFVAVSEVFGSQAIQYISAFSILLIFWSTFFLLKGILNNYDIRLPDVFLLFLSQVMIFFFLYLSPDIEQSVYWRSGLSHYFIPLFFLISIFILVFSNDSIKRKILLSVLIFFIAFLGAGLSESYAALQTGALLIAIIALVIFQPTKRNAKTLLLIAAIAGSLGGMAVMILSPGNQLRLNILQQAPDVWTIFRLSVVFGFQFLIDSFKGLWLPLGISIAICFFSGTLFFIDSSYTLTTSKKIASGIFIPITIFFLIVCICAPTAYGMMAYPENRVLMLAHGVTVSGIILYGLFLGFIVKDFFILESRWKGILIVGVLILSLYPLRSVNRLWGEVQSAKERAQQWDQRNSAIYDQIALGEVNLKVRALNSFDQIAELGNDSSFWVNQCVAQFYEVESITAIESMHE